MTASARGGAPSQRGADDWWDVFKAAREPAHEAPGPDAAPPTLAIDLDERCRVAVPVPRG